MRPTVFTPVDELTRRGLLTGAGAVGALTLLPSRSWGQEPGTFPVTIAHKYGGTEITAEPKRVVTVGLSDQDPVLALGVQPVGVTEWYGDYPFAVWPWPAAGAADPGLDAVDASGLKTSSARPSQRCCASWTRTRSPTSSRWPRCVPT